MTNPFTDNTAIQILLHRNRNPDLDDRLVIRYKDENQYQLFFQDGYSTPSRAYCTILTGDEVDTYIHSLFTLLANDTDPFRHIQFFIPCFPTILYDIEDLQNGAIRKALKQILPILSTASRY